MFISIVHGVLCHYKYGRHAIFGPYKSHYPNIISLITISSQKYSKTYMKASSLPYYCTHIYHMFTI